MDSPPSFYELPSGLFHSTWLDGNKINPERFQMTSKLAPDWKRWTVKLQFKKNSQLGYGTGFYTNIPNARFHIILTAGHNLVESPGKLCSEIRIKEFTDPKDPKGIDDAGIEVETNMIRVCDEYYKNPDELHAIFDYGAILLNIVDAKRYPHRRGFGFNLQLGLTPSLEEDSGYRALETDLLQDKALSVSGYAPGNTVPIESRGACIQANDDQLIYEASTEQGMSGGPVWLGYGNDLTVVAIHNYGEEKAGDGNKGTRLTLDVWRTIFSWAGVGWNNVVLQHIARPSYKMHLHVDETGEGRVRIGCPGRIETRFDVLPVSAPPEKIPGEARFGFLLRNGDGETGAPSNSCPNNNNTIANSISYRGWLRWDPDAARVTVTDPFDALCGVKLLNVIARPALPFAIQAGKKGTGWKDVKMSMDLVEEEYLEALKFDEDESEDTSEISFETVGKDKKFTFQYYAENTTPLFLTVLL